MKKINLYLLPVFFIFLISCQPSKKDKSAAEILGNPDYLAISYGGYRSETRDVQPTLEELKEDLMIMHAMGIRIFRTYNVHLPQAENLLQAIDELKKENPEFEMYVMLGAWIDCKNAWTDMEPDHATESDRNEVEIEKAVALTNKYPDIVKVLAVGNEAMVHWATSYYVEPVIILKYVKRLQRLKKQGQLPAGLWITSSDNFASWGGGDSSYYKPALVDLIKEVDYVSMHTYPFHDTHWDPDFWKLNPVDTTQFSNPESIKLAAKRALERAISQYESVKEYVENYAPGKPIHIGETGWATNSKGMYGKGGSYAADEYKQGLYFQLIREWTNTNNISCFYFEAFDEKWKDPTDPQGSENHFGLITLDGQAKYPLWSSVEKGIFNNLTRNGNPITKTYEGSEEKLIEDILISTNQ